MCNSLRLLGEPMWGRTYVGEPMLENLGASATMQPSTDSVPDTGLPVPGLGGFPIEDIPATIPRVGYGRPRG